VLPCLSEDGHFIFKGLQLGRCRIFNIQRFDGDWSVPMTSIYGSEGTGSDSWTNQYLVSRNLPVFDGFAGCAHLKVKNHPSDDETFNILDIEVTFLLLSSALRALGLHGLRVLVGLAWAL
jgi:hypothetical protein